jgi:hypothetical protein
MIVPDNTVSCKPEFLHLGKKCLGFQLDSPRQQLSRARSQDNGQGIIDLVGVTKTNNIAILIHGVSLSLRGSGRLDGGYQAVTAPEHDRADKLMSDLPRMTADAMTAKETAARLEGELAALRSRPWWKRLAG